MHTVRAPINRCNRTKLIVTLFLYLVFFAVIIRYAPSMNKYVLTRSNLPWEPDREGDAARIAQLNLEKGMMKRNFASATAGAQVLTSSPTCTALYPSTYFIWWAVQTTAPPPITALKPTTDVGDCWPMLSDRGYLAVDLAAQCYVKGFTIEHIDSLLHLGGNRTEAPQNFSVVGILEGGVKHVYGSYTYLKHGPAEQTFTIQNDIELPVWVVYLMIHSNHGHHAYTCIYRFQVHGIIASCPNCKY